MVSYLPFFMDDMLVFCADFVNKDIEVDLVASRSKAARYGVLG